MSELSGKAKGMFSVLSDFGRHLSYLGTQYHPYAAVKNRDAQIFVIRTNKIAYLIAGAFILLAVFDYPLAYDFRKSCLIFLAAMFVILGQSLKWIGKIEMSGHVIFLATACHFVFLEYYTLINEKTQGGFYLYLFVSFIITLLVSTSMVSRAWIHTLILLLYPVAGVVICLTVFPRMFPWGFQTGGNSFIVNTIFSISILLLISLIHFRKLSKYKKQSEHRREHDQAFSVRTEPVNGNASDINSNGTFFSPANYPISIQTSSDCGPSSGISDHDTAPAPGSLEKITAAAGHQSGNGVFTSAAPLLNPGIRNLKKQ